MICRCGSMYECMNYWAFHSELAYYLRMQYYVYTNLLSRSHFALLAVTPVELLYWLIQ